MDQLTLLITSFADLIPPALEAIFAVMALASAITALTPTPRDDEFVGRLYRIVELLALNVGYAKDLPPNSQGGRFVPR